MTCRSRSCCRWSATDGACGPSPIPHVSDCSSRQAMGHASAKLPASAGETVSTGCPSTPMLSPAASCLPHLHQDSRQSGRRAPWSSPQELTAGACSSSPSPKSCDPRVPAVSVCSRPQAPPAATRRSRTSGLEQPPPGASSTTGDLAASVPGTWPPQGSAQRPRGASHEPASGGIPRCGPAAVFLRGEPSPEALPCDCRTAAHGQ